MPAIVLRTHGGMRLYLDATDSSAGGGFHVAAGAQIVSHYPARFESGYKESADPLSSLYWRWVPAEDVYDNLSVTISQTTGGGATDTKGVFLPGAGEIPIDIEYGYIQTFGTPQPTRGQLSCVFRLETVSGANRLAAPRGPLCAGYVYQDHPVILGGNIEDVSQTSISGTVTVSGTVSVSGTVTVSGTVSVSGTVTVSGTVAVSGTVSISGAVTISSGTVSISGTVNISGPVTINTGGVFPQAITYDASGNVQFNVNAQGKAIFTGPNFTTGHAYIMENLNLSSLDSYVQMVIAVPSGGFIRIRRVVYFWSRGSQILQYLTVNPTTPVASDDGVLDAICQEAAQMNVAWPAPFTEVPIEHGTLRTTFASSGAAGSATLGTKAATTTGGPLVFEIDRIYYNSTGGSVNLTYKLDLNNPNFGASYNVGMYLEFEGSSGLTFTGTFVSNGGGSTGGGGGSGGGGPKPI